MARNVRFRAAFAFIFAAAALDGCIPPLSAASVERASNELACAAPNINVVARDDISPGVFDVEACGRRARYHCEYLYRSYLRESSCAREPDPPVWDPDPASLADLLGSTGSPPTRYREAHICDLPRGSDCDCFGWSATSSWQFYSCKTATPEVPAPERQPVGGL